MVPVKPILRYYILSEPRELGKFKVVLSLNHRIILNFGKSCVLSCVSKVDDIKQFNCVYWF